ncbi:MAG TPA: aminopeptidase P family N-terminal domain-containing protein [Acidisarcina sp.]|nr:aminopeptidase P family N-terminal domain-containing protein [Acidisarcina sp.]
MTKIISRELIIGGETLVAESAWNAEIEGKHARLSAFLRAQGLAAVLIRRSENIAWATGGAVEMRVCIPQETAVGALLITAQGRRFYLTTENESRRQAEEEFEDLDFEAVTYPWYEDKLLSQARKLAGGPLGCDYPTADFTPVNFYPLRASLTEPEIARYRWLGRQTADATVEVLESLEPGITEYEMEGRIGHALLRRGILPSVLLMAADDRVLRYKHAVARGAVLEEFGMLNLCSRKWGLSVSMTRFVHFGPLPSELAVRFVAASKVNAALLDATRVGATGADLFAVAQKAYQEVGFAGEEERHHQGGPTGYLEREWVATPAGSDTVVDAQAFAWNPSIRGGKVEDTLLLQGGAWELLTPTPSLPRIEAPVDDSVYSATGVLIR